MISPQLVLKYRFVLSGKWNHLSICSLLKIYDNKSMTTPFLEMKNKQSIVDVLRRILAKNPLWSTRLVKLQATCLQLYIKLNFVANHVLRIFPNFSAHYVAHLKSASGACKNYDTDFSMWISRVSMTQT